MFIFQTGQLQHPSITCCLFRVRGQQITHLLTRYLKIARQIFAGTSWMEDGAVIC